jgi:hypothetical protein
VKQGKARAARELPPVKSGLGRSAFAASARPHDRKKMNEWSRSRLPAGARGCAGRKWTSASET